MIQGDIIKYLGEGFRKELFEPFGEPMPECREVMGCVDYGITNIKNRDKYLGWNFIHPHLIKEHHFYQGREGGFRVPPERIFEVLLE